jgi:DNA repair protein SbcD/Mre11
MRLLHTGDWHLGKRLHGTERLGEAEAALAELGELAEREEVDAILVAGDLLDRRLVDPAALGACLRGLDRLAATAPVLAVAGNHDDPDLWGHLAPFLAGRGIHVAGRLRTAHEAVVTVPTDAGPLHAALLPWPEPGRMAVDAGVTVQEARSRYADMVGAVIDRYAREAVARRRAEGGAAILVGHLMVDRAEAGGGEREMTMGITWTVSTAALPVDLDYIALGHVHRPQPLPGFSASGRYCGSPMALDFSEDGHAKSAVVATIEGDRTLSREEPLSAAASLVRLRGSLEAMAPLAAEHPGAWFACDVELDAPLPDLVRRVREAVPRALRVEPLYARPQDEPGPTGPADAAALGLGDLYARWYAEGDRVLGAAQAEAFAAAVAAGAAEDGDEG